MNECSIERLHEVFSLDGGRLINKIKRKGAAVGQECGRRTTGNRYSRVRVDGVLFQAHRVVWAMTHGEWPIMDIDHINGDCHDNRPDNLRSVSRSTNMKNAKIRANSLTGCHGVNYRPHYNGKNPWRAAIGGKHIGVYETLLDAACARKSIEQDHGYHRNHGRGGVG